MQPMNVDATAGGGRVRTRAEEEGAERNRRQNVIRIGAMLCLLLTLYDGGGASSTANAAAAAAKRSGGAAGSTIGAAAQHEALSAPYAAQVNALTRPTRDLLAIPHNATGVYHGS
jgi:hypothetical protein